MAGRRLPSGSAGTVSAMEQEHIDRQPPRDAEEEAEQDELMRGGAEQAATELSTSAPAADLDRADEG